MQWSPSKCNKSRKTGPVSCKQRPKLSAKNKLATVKKYANYMTTCIFSFPNTVPESATRFPPVEGTTWQLGAVLYITPKAVQNCQLKKTPSG
jgi:hypothetical protein